MDKRQPAHQGPATVDRRELALSLGRAIGGDLAIVAMVVESETGADDLVVLQQPWATEP